MIKKSEQAEFTGFDDGEEMAWEQFDLGGKFQPEPEQNYSGKFVALDNRTDVIGIQGDNFSVKFDKNTGWLRDYTFDGTTLVSGQMRLN
ncbi:MAG: hypothetical protein PUJ15_07440, partial [Bacteroidaceae bacterium]|nr:hypothetical protein [Bacteroidaceae bacterium]